MIKVKFPSNLILGVIIVLLIIGIIYLQIEQSKYLDLQKNYTALVNNYSRSELALNAKLQMYTHPFHDQLESNQNYFLRGTKPYLTFYNNLYNLYNNITIVNSTYFFFSEGQQGIIRIHIHSSPYANISIFATYTPQLNFTSDIFSLSGYQIYTNSTDETIDIPILNKSGHVSIGNDNPQGVSINYSADFYGYWPK